jgi:hypothetical protein
MGNRNVSRYCASETRTARRQDETYLTSKLEQTIVIVRLCKFSIAVLFFPRYPLRHAERTIASVCDGGGASSIVSNAW